ncbi:hypothetical protein HY486_02035 [Candidatus Woesearchaeota archaeon]|nr:hypothetical protein [Candidatus Woesearchaeota archaeon]
MESSRFLLLFFGFIVLASAVVMFYSFNETEGRVWWDDWSRAEGGPYGYNTGECQDIPVRYAYQKCVLSGYKERSASQQRGRISNVPVSRRSNSESGKIKRA